MSHLLNILVVRQNCVYSFLSGFYLHLALYTGFSRPAAPCIPQRGCAVAGSQSSNSQWWECDAYGLVCNASSQIKSLSILRGAVFVLASPIQKERDEKQTMGRKTEKCCWYCWSSKQLVTVAAVLESWRWRQTFQQRSHDLLLLVQGPTWNISIWKCSTYRLCI